MTLHCGLKIEQDVASAWEAQVGKQSRTAAERSKCITDTTAGCIISTNAQTNTTFHVPRMYINIKCTKNLQRNVYKESWCSRKNTGFRVNSDLNSCPDALGFTTQSNQPGFSEAHAPCSSDREAFLRGLWEASEDGKLGCLKEGPATTHRPRPRRPHWSLPTEQDTLSSTTQNRTSPWPRLMKCKYQASTSI